MKIPIKGIIVSNDDQWIYDWFGYESTSPKNVSDLIDSANGEELDAEINSPGGDVYAGSDIYTQLMSYKRKVTTNIFGVAASAASIIAMAGRPARISPTAQLMIHNVMAGDYGDYRKLQYGAEIIKNYNISIANAYRLKTGMEESKLLEMMNAGGSINYGTSLNAQQALENKFVDEIMFDEGGKLVASANFSEMLPPSAIYKLKNFLKQNHDSKIIGANGITKDALLNAMQLIVNELKPNNAQPEADLKPKSTTDMSKYAAKIQHLTERSNKRNG